MPKRHIMRIELTGPAEQNVGRVCDHHGMTQRALISKLVEWLADQDVMMQSTVLGRFPFETKPDTPKMVLERMARGG